ncbi:MAG: deoxyribodipyrimidine photo-lyase [Ignavibacteria bacterium]|nr:deoxyribodipyrimidine photo-lyase [Ignavibacteria bacterium]
MFEKSNTILKIFWFRKDLRISDNAGLSDFIKDYGNGEIFSFIYIKNKNTYVYSGKKRIEFLDESLKDLKENLAKYNLILNVIEGNSENIFKTLTGYYGNICIYANYQVEPYCIKRDEIIKKIIEKNNGVFKLFTDTTIFKCGEIMKDDGTPYTVYTPFSKKLKLLLTKKQYNTYVYKISTLNKKYNIDLKKENIELDFYEFNGKKPERIFYGGRTKGIKLLNEFIDNRIEKYKSQRDFPAVDGTSRISAHIHFGTVSIRECLGKAMNLIKNSKYENEIQTWINELLWREFYYNITFHFSYIINYSFKKEYDNLKWNYNRKMFRLWCEGKTGYPIIDAAMRQMNEEGWMHNRVRMATAMFLTKDLFIDWRWGEKYFAEKLIDLDFSSNNGGWQWSASTGCDAQPYFRIFNPVLQSKKFDTEGIFIKKYLPELRNLPSKFIHEPWIFSDDILKSCKIKIGKDYPLPIVNHFEAKERVINEFRAINKNQ